MIVSLCLFTILVAVPVGYAIVSAAREDHLLLFYWGEGEPFAFVRGAGRRYDRIPLWKVPLAAVRYEVGRARQRLSPPKPAPAMAQAQQVHRFARLAH
jgi:hypothetical protein